jgi:DNA-binding transcriptional ArsR family regulator
VAKHQELERTLSAVADPTRRQILDRLARGPASISQLAGPLAMSLPGLMKHVRILEEAGLVETRKVGRTRECRLGPSRLDEVAEWVETYRRRWEGRLDRPGRYLATKEVPKR